MAQFALLSAQLLLEMRPEVYHAFPHVCSLIKSGTRCSHKNSKKSFKEPQAAYDNAETKGRERRDTAQQQGQECLKGTVCSHPFCCRFPPPGPRLAASSAPCRTAHPQHSETPPASLRAADVASLLPSLPPRRSPATPPLTCSSVSGGHSALTSRSYKMFSSPSSSSLTATIPSALGAPSPPAVAILAQTLPPPQRRRCPAEAKPAAPAAPRLTPSAPRSGARGNCHRCGSGCGAPKWHLLLLGSCTIEEGGVRLRSPLHFRGCADGRQLQVVAAAVGLLGSQDCSGGKRESS